MKQHKRKLALLAAAILACSAAGCAGTQDQSSAQSQSQLWVVDNSVDVQQDYVMENPSAIGDLTTPVRVISKEEQAASQRAEQPDEVRAIWLSYLDLKPMLLNSDDSSVGQEQFTKNIEQAFDNVKALGLNTVIAQVRPFSDALYESELFPWSYLAGGEEGVDPGFDPLEIMVEEAHERGLRLEAWLNPYRVRNSATNAELSAENPATAMLKTGDAIQYNGAITYNPASKKAQQLIVDGVREIVENYEVDGIHFDDYFYPTTDVAFDAASYAQYQTGGGTMSLADWRRENVNQLVRAVYAAVKEIDPEVVFGISPQGNMENNYDKQFIDVEEWLTEDGYIDYICPQIYFGFDNSTYPYAETVEAWSDLIENDVQLYIGLSPYKIGTEDTYAGSGRWEWANSGDILVRQVDTARQAEHYKGFSLFRYDSVFQPQSGVKAAVQEEIDSLKQVL